MGELQRKAGIAESTTEKVAVEDDVLANNLEAQWLLKALNNMEEQIKAGFDITDELNRQIAWYKKSGNSELLITHAMWIVAKVGLPYIRSDKIEARDILEVAPDAIVHAALIHTDEGTDFITCLTATMEEFCIEFSNEGNVVDVALLPAQNEKIRKPKSSFDMLALRAQAGDSYAMNKVLEKCKPLVWSLIRKRQYNLPDGDVHDLYQEAMTSIARAIKIYDVTKSSFYSLAKLAAIRALLTAVKTSNRNKHKHLNGADSLDQPIGDKENSLTLGETISHPRTDVFHIIAVEETLAELDELLTHDLSDMEWQCLTLLIERRSHKEIADITGYSLRSIDNALQRVRKKIIMSGILK